MKNYFLVLLIILPFAANAQSITDGLIGYWPFNGNANDESGNGNNVLAINGATLTSDRNNNSESAYYFDGQSEMIVNQGLNAPHITITCWINMQENYSNNYLISKWKTGNLAYGIRMDNYNLRFFINTTNGTITKSFSDLEISQDEWVFLAVTYDGNTLNGYLNGNKSIEEVTHSGDITSSISNFIIGNNSNSSQPFKGMIDDILIYERALSDSEIQSIYVSGITEQSNICANIHCDGGNVGIGTSDTQGYTLAVAGDVIAEEVKVALINYWPDYVFEEGFELSSLESLKEYINTHGHLPEIPAAEDVKIKGIQLGQMNAALLKKIEELTIYLISQNEKQKELETRIAELEKKRK